MKRQHLNRMNASELYHHKPAGELGLAADRERTVSLQRAVAKHRQMQVFGPATDCTPKRNSNSIVGPFGSRTMQASRLSRGTETDPRITR